MMNPKIELLALSKGVDELCKDNDIDPARIIEWMIEEEMIDLEEYFPEEKEDE